MTPPDSPPDTNDVDDHRYAWPSANVGDDRHRWARRTLFGVLLVGAAAFVVFAFSHAPDNEQAPTHDPAVVREVPLPGSHILHQAQIGAYLQQGYDGRLVVNGVAVPETDMDGAIPVTSREYDPKLGPRPNNRNEVLFTPGKGKVIENYDTGDVTITLRYWNIARGQRSARTLTWHFTVN